MKVEGRMNAKMCGYCLAGTHSLSRCHAPCVCGDQGHVETPEIRARQRAYLFPEPVLDAPARRRVVR